MDNKDRMDSLVNKVKEMVKASKVRVKVNPMVNTTMVMDSPAIAPIMDLVISLDRDKVRDNLVMVVLKDKVKEKVLVMNVAEELISSD